MASDEPFPEKLVDLPGFFAFALDQFPSSVLVFDASGHCTWANAAAVRSLRYTRDELLAMDLFRIDPTFSPDRLLRAIEKGGGYTLRSFHRRKDGTSFPVEISASVLEIAERRLVVAFAQDITDRLGTERKASLLFSGSSIGVIFFDAEGRILQANPACLEMFGYAPEDLDRILGKNAFDYMVPEDRPRALASFANRMVENGILKFKSKVNRYRMQRPDGSQFMCEARATAIPDGKGGLEAAALFIADVSELVYAQEQLRHLEKMEAVGQLAGGVAHDFNNQLTGIIGFAEILRDRLEVENPLRGYAEGIVSAAKRSAQLTGKLLAFSRKGVMQTSVVDILAVVRDVVAMLERSIDKRIRIVQPEQSEPCFLEGDSAQLQNALLNLAINARDAMPEGGTLAFSVRTLALDEDFCDLRSPRIKPGNYLCLVIEDSGHGMTEAVQRHIFEPFFTTKPKGKGTGLGLASVWGIVKSHRGAIDVESAVGRGTRFRLYLPLVDRSSSSESLPLPRAAIPPLQILMVEDEAVVARVAREILMRLGHGVDLAQDGIEGIELLCRDPGRYQMVLLDLVLPTISGQETYEALRRIAPGLPILLTSGHDLEEQIRPLLAQGKVGFVKKPYDLSSLGAAIDSLV
jgi:PAS domain S-box-containing protein